MTHRVTRIAAALALAAGAIAVGSGPASAAGGINDPSCQPTAAHPQPVVMLHGLGANMNEDINFLQDDLASKGYCSFALTYGAPDGQTLVGGLGPLPTSPQHIRVFLLHVLRQPRA